MSKQSLVLGCDPGMTGAIAVTLQDGRTIKVFQVPTGYRGTRKELDLLSLMRCLAPLAKHDCVMGIEDVFTFGSEHDTPLTAWQLASALWGVRGIAVGLGMRVIMVPARDWKKHFSLWGLGREEGKAAAILKIKSDFMNDFPGICPRSKRGNGVRQPSADFAEALLIAKYVQHLNLSKNLAS